MLKFSQRLRELRISKNLSQQKLADILKTSKSSINMYERGEREPGLEMIEAIADFFNVDLNYLLGMSDIPDRTFYANTNDSAETSNYVIGYMDILGTKERIKKDSTKLSSDFKELYTIFKGALIYIKDTKKDIFSRISFKIFSDNILIALKNTDKHSINEDVQNIITILCYFQLFSFASYGFILRGAITFGDLYIDDTFVIGKSLLDAYHLESKIAKKPRIIINNAVIEDFDSIKYICRDIDDLYFINYLDAFNEYVKTNGEEKCTVLRNNIVSNIILLTEEANNNKYFSKLKWVYDYTATYLQKHNYQLSLNDTEKEIIENNLSNLKANQHIEDSIPSTYSTFVSKQLVSAEPVVEDDVLFAAESKIAASEQDKFEQKTIRGKRRIKAAENNNG